MTHPGGPDSQPISTSQKKGDNSINETDFYDRTLGSPLGGFPGKSARDEGNFDLVRVRPGVITTRERRG
ncbi:MAG TPA: hypothetical protein VEW42_03460 [Candidatus Eisenbacteria bacterium]|nr:hypothetical protein [Candidatus Eisenbacteria bacterium]